MRILVVEDDVELQAQLQQRLQQLDYQVNIAGDGEEALYFIGEYEFDLAVIDLGLPKIDGIAVIEHLRSNHHSLPILILTARSGWKSKVQGLHAGADDYLTKPFQPEELDARIHALLRRSSGFTKNQLTIGPITLDLATNAVFVNQQEINLTAFEYRLLEHFMRNPRKIISKTQLSDRLYEDNEDKDSNVLEVMITRLRRKLDPEGLYRPIETLRGRGYRFMGDTT